MAEYPFIEEVGQGFAVLTDFHVYGQYGHAPRAAFASRIHNGNRHVEGVGQYLLADDRRLEQAALGDHDVCFNAFFLNQDIHAYFQRRKGCVQLGQHEVRQGKAAVRRTDEQWPAIVDARYVFARQIAVVDQSSRILVGRAGQVEQRFIQLVRPDRQSRRRGKLSEQVDPGVDVRRAVIRMYHGDRSPVRRRDDVNIFMDALQRPVQYVHGKSRRADGNVAGPFADAVRADHARTGVSFGRSHMAAPFQTACRIEEARPFFRQGTGPFSGPQYLRQEVGKLPRIGLYRFQSVEQGQHLCVVRACSFVDGEHARRVADAQDFFAAQLPVDVSGQGRQEGNLRHMVFSI